MHGLPAAALRKRYPSLIGCIAIGHLADADGVPVTNEISWDLSHKWLALVARSGPASFVSVDRSILQPHQKRALQSALAGASRK